MRNQTKIEIIEMLNEKVEELLDSRDMEMYEGYNCSHYKPKLEDLEEVILLISNISTKE